MKLIKGEFDRIAHVATALATAVTIAGHGGEADAMRARERINAYVEQLEDLIARMPQHMGEEQDRE